MAPIGQTLENPASGERITFRATAAQSNGELVAIDFELPARRRVPGRLHVHPKQEERAPCASVEIRPALRMEQMFKTAVALAQNGRTTRGGLPKPLDLAVFARESTMRSAPPSRRARCSGSSWRLWPGWPGSAGRTRGRFSWVIRRVS